MGSGVSVCKHGQLGVGTGSALNDLTSDVGVLLANNAAEIATTNPVQIVASANPAMQAPCVGTWDSGAGVTCDSNGNVVSAIDSVGQHWNCNKATTSTTGSADLQLLACCDLA